MNITIFGSGYVGLVSAVCFAEMGNNVVCVDVDERKIAQLSQGISPIYEPGLDALLDRNLKGGRLHFTTEASAAVGAASIIFIAVGTPPEEDGSADLQYVLAVAETIGRHLDCYKVVVNKSTVPVGTADRVKACLDAVLDARGAQHPVDVVSNPEFLKEGEAIADCMKPDRIIIGSSSDRAIALMKDLYRPFNRNHEKLMVMDERSSEMTKYVANAMLATKISFMNEMSQVAERLGADIESVRRGIGSDPRIGYHFIYPGCGYGGSCFPKDVKALRHMAEQSGYHTRVVDAVDVVNNEQKSSLFDKVNQYFNRDLNGKTFAIWGVAFKPKTDDIREAPSRRLIEQLWRAGADVRLYDPVAADNFESTYGGRDDYVCCDTAIQALEGSDSLIIVTEWAHFRSPDFIKIKSLLKTSVIFDGRNLYDPKTLQTLGFDYISMGRMPILQNDDTQ